MPRNFSKPVRDFLVVLDEEETDPGKAEYVNSLSYEPTIPSKFMIGTGQVEFICWSPKLAWPPKTKI